MAYRKSTTRGFKRTASILGPQFRKAGESRGFAVSRLLTHWGEIAGPEFAACAQPVKVGYGKGGLGATLTVLTTGAQAPMLEMQKERLRAQVNAVYGYNAIARIRITQTAATGFGEDATPFTPAPPVRAAKPEPSPAQSAAAQGLARPVADDGLRQALERLGQNVLSRHNN